MKFNRIYLWKLNIKLDYTLLKISFWILKIDSSFKNCQIINIKIDPIADRNPTNYFKII